MGKRNSDKWNQESISGGHDIIILLKDGLEFHRYKKMYRIQEQ